MRNFCLTKSKMLFALWAGNRATQDAEPMDMSYNSAVGSGSRSSNVVISSEIANDAVNDEKGTMDSKPGLEANEAFREMQYEDSRPVVFKSNFWEICCIASLVCGQLTYVQHTAKALIVRKWHILN